MKLTASGFHYGWTMAMASKNVDLVEENNAGVEPCTFTGKFLHVSHHWKLQVI